MHPSVELEASFSGAVRDFLRARSSRFRGPEVGDEWVRVCPSTADEVRSCAEFPDLIKFFQPGSLVEVKGFDGTYVDVLCARDVLVTHVEYFRSSYVRLIRGREWRSQAARALQASGV